MTGSPVQPSGQPLLNRYRTGLKRDLGFKNPKIITQAQGPRRRPPPLAPNPPPSTPNPPPPWTTLPLSHSSFSPESTIIGTESTTIGTNPPPSAPNPPSPAPNPPPPWTTPPLSHSSSSSESPVPVRQNPFRFDGFEVEPQVVTVQADFRCSLDSRG
ncbi:hypothetical protein Acr_29g0010550 [Actinidia rufa]|uniref:Uncharacterized protein n=1 Tax=Actinidia rufa TaxID=165716 RepID=A0A7J0HFK8_9ERIC|nr:hypothetical protein Acr_29g0010550 [Actinidia rufa]